MDTASNVCDGMLLGEIYCMASANQKILPNVMFLNSNCAIFATFCDIYRQSIRAYNDAYHLDLSSIAEKGL